MKLEAKQRLLAAFTVADVEAALALNCKHMRVEFEPMRVSTLTPNAVLGTAEVNGTKFVITLISKALKSITVHFDPQYDGRDAKAKEATSTLTRRMDGLDLRTFKKPTGVAVNIAMDDALRQSYPDIPSFPKVRK